MLAMLAEVRREVRAGAWPGGSLPPHFDRMVGLEMRPRVARIARTALGDEAEILTVDARSSSMPKAHAVLLFDVLHLMAADDQESLLASLAASLQPDGMIVVREADASAGWRFAAVRIGNRLKALAIGRWRQSFPLPIDDRVAAVLRAAWASRGGSPDGRRHAVRERAVSRDGVGGQSGRVAAGSAPTSPRAPAV